MDPKDNSFSFGKDCSFRTLWIKSVRKRDLEEQARVVAPAESLPGAKQTRFKTQGPQTAAVYVLICLLYGGVFPPLFGTLVLLIK